MSAGWVPIPWSRAAAPARPAAACSGPAAAPSPIGAPRAEPAHAERRVDLPAPAVGVWRPPGHQVAEPLRDSRGFMRPRRSASSSIVPGRRDRPSTLRRKSSQVPSSSASSLVRSWSGMSGMLRGAAAVEVDQVADPMRQGGRELHGDPAPFECPTIGSGAGHRVDHRHGVPQVGLPRVEGGVLGVAVATLVPRHDPPAGLRQHGGEDVEGAGEVEPAVRQHQAGRRARPTRGRPGECRGRRRPACDRGRGRRGTRPPLARRSRLGPLSRREIDPKVKDRATHPACDR